MSWGAIGWGGLEGGSDAIPPSIGNFVPPEGVALGRTDYIQFDVTDNSGQFAYMALYARFMSQGVCETVFNSLGFESRYAAGSSRAAIANGYRFTVRRTGGWTSTPVIFSIAATDNCGNTTRVEITR